MTDDTRLYFYLYRFTPEQMQEKKDRWFVPPTREQYDELCGIIGYNKAPPTYEMYVDHCKRYHDEEKLTDLIVYKVPISESQRQVMREELEAMPGFEYWLGETP